MFNSRFYRNHHDASNKGVSLPDGHFVRIPFAAVYEEFESAECNTKCKSQNSKNFITSMLVMNRLNSGIFSKFHMDWNFQKLIGDSWKVWDVGNRFIALKCYMEKVINILILPPPSLSPDHIFLSVVFKFNTHSIRILHYYNYLE